jgi:hypothetical protein
MLSQSSPCVGCYMYVDSADGGWVHLAKRVLKYGFTMGSSDTKMDINTVLGVGPYTRPLGGLGHYGRQVGTWKCRFLELLHSVIKLFPFISDWPHKAVPSRWNDEIHWPDFASCCSWAYHNSSSFLRLTAHTSISASVRLFRRVPCPCALLLPRWRGCPLKKYILFF